jgi:hypothetical protein
MTYERFVYSSHGWNRREARRNQLESTRSQLIPLHSIVAHLFTLEASEFEPRTSNGYFDLRAFVIVKRFAEVCREKCDVVVIQCQSSPGNDHSLA